MFDTFLLCMKSILHVYDMLIDNVIHMMRTLGSCMHMQKAASQWNMHAAAAAAHVHGTHRRSFILADLHLHQWRLRLATIAANS